MPDACTARRTGSSFDSSLSPSTARSASRSCSVEVGTPDRISSPTAGRWSIRERRRGRRGPIRPTSAPPEASSRSPSTGTSTPVVAGSAIGPPGTSRAADRRSSRTPATAGSCPWGTGCCRSPVRTRRSPPSTGCVKTTRPTAGPPGPWPRPTSTPGAFSPTSSSRACEPMKLRLVVLGMMGRCPFGGQTWLYLNWLRGLSRLGHEVWYVEDDTVWPYDPESDTVTDDCAYAVAHIANVMARIGLPAQWAYRLADRPDACWGLRAAQLAELYQSC